MALTKLDAKIIAQFQATVGRADDLSNPEATAQVNRVLNFVIGSAGAISGANEVWYKRVILAGSATNDHDMIGTSEENPLGEDIDFTIIRGIIVINQSDITFGAHTANTTAIIQVMGAANAIPAFTDLTDSVDLHAGDIFMLTRNTVAGITLVADTADLITIEETNGTEALYDIFVIGET